MQVYAGGKYFLFPAEDLYFLMKSWRIDELRNEVPKLDWPMTFRIGDSGNESLMKRETRTNLVEKEHWQCE